MASLPPKPEQIQLNLNQLMAVKSLKAPKGGNLFLTGGAGTGKSTVLRQFIKEAAITTKLCPVLASTGAAAILIGGRTFHSFFGLGIMQGGARATFDRVLKDKKVARRIRNAESVVLDEISMISFEALDLAEAIARALRDQNDEPWGGLRMISVGDFFQLPPVKRRSSEFDLNWTRTPWAFLGEAWSSSRFEWMELQEIVRTEDRSYMEILSDLRQGLLSERVRNFLNDQTRSAAQVLESNDAATFLFPRRAQAEAFNKSRLADLAGKVKRFETVYGGNSRLFDVLKKEAPVPEVLELKKGALVMIRFNDPRQRFVNGTLAYVQTMYDEALVLETLKGRMIELEPMSFSIYDAEGNEAAFAKNFPVNLAYASTIHKIQGATLDRVHVDLQGLWEAGQAYVALSRVRRAQDITHSGWTARSVRADALVSSFYRSRGQVSSDEVFRRDDVAEAEWIEN